MTRWMLAGCMAVAALGAALTGGVAEAGKPGGGGPIPPGTIYFNGADGLWSMNPDGSGKTALPTSVRGVPSNQAHGGARWFLKDHFGQLHATREDGSSDVQLTIDLPVSEWVPFTFTWGRDDSFVSCTSPDPDAFQVHGVRLCRVEIAFDVNGVPSAAGGPVAFSGIASYFSLPHAWSPSGDRVAWFHLDGGYGQNVLNVTTIATGATSSIASFTYYHVRGLAWSPDGARILIGWDEGIDTIEPSGANRRHLLSGSRSGSRNRVVLGAGDWSPDSAAIVYGRSVYELVRVSNRFYDIGDGDYYELVSADVYRASADGSATLNLTSDVSSPAYPVAWR